MAETVATAAGIAGIVGVLQSLLQCYKDFLTARDFGNDFAVCQLQAALLENSTVTWAVAVGLRHESGEPRNEFVVRQPTEHRATMAKNVLDLIQRNLDTANQELNYYTIADSLSTDTAVEPLSDKSSLMARVAKKIHRSVHREHDAEHPGTLKRTTWALIDKANLEKTLDTVTKLVDRLNTDFAPVDQKQHLDQYCEVVKELSLSDQELREIGAAAGDKMFKTVVEMLQGERATGDRFVGLKVTKEGTVVRGDHYDKEWNGDVQGQSSRNNTFEDVLVTDSGLMSIGNTYGGKSPLQLRLEQQGASRRMQSGHASD